MSRYLLVSADRGLVKVFTNVKKITSWFMGLKDETLLFIKEEDDRSKPRLVKIKKKLDAPAIEEALEKA